MASKSKPKRIGAFICLILGIIVLLCSFLPIYTVSAKIPDNVVVPDSSDIADAKIGITAYDAFKALIKKDHLLPENFETKIYDVIMKVDKNLQLSTSGSGHADVFKTMTENKTISLYTYIIYIGAVAMMFSGALMVVFGLLGTLIRAKLFKSFNILFSLLALLGGGATIAGSVLIGAKYTEAMLGLMTLSMSYFLIIPVAVAFISLICLLAIRNKRRIK